jgi:exonuclease SbcD
VFRSFRRVGRAGTRTVVIAGNHDDPLRLDASGTLAELVDVTTVARPRRADEGRIVEHETRSGQRAVIAAVPFAKPSDLVSAAQMAEGDMQAHQLYAEGMRGMIEHLSARFRRDAVNLLLSHTHLDAAVLAGSERRVHLGEEWAATAQVLPSTAHYIGLGHIHRPQRIESAPSPTCYAGSPLQLDFGEIGEQKTFVVVTAEPGRPARIEHVAYDGGKSLHDIRNTLPELEQQAERLRQLGWLRVTVPLDAPDIDLNRKVRQLLGSAVVSVDYALPERSDRAQPPRRAGLGPAELFGLYREAQYGAVPEADLTAAFSQLLREAEELAD